MNKKSIIFGVAAMMAVVVVGLSVSTFVNAGEKGAFGLGQGMKRNQLSEEERATMEETRELKMAENEAKREAVKLALNNSNYDEWVKAVGENCPILEKITEENFSKFVEAHNHMEEGKKIMEELGLEKGMGCVFGGGDGGRHFGVK